MCHIAMQASGEDKQHINITCHLATVALGKINNISHITAQALGGNNTCRIATEASGETTHNINAI